MVAPGGAFSPMGAVDDGERTTPAFESFAGACFLPFFFPPPEVFPLVVTNGVLITALFPVVGVRELATDVDGDGATSGDGVAEGDSATWPPLPPPPTIAGCGSCECCCGWTAGFDTIWLGNKCCC